MRCRAIFALLLAASSTGFALDQSAYDAAVEHYTQHRPAEAQAEFEKLAAVEPNHADIQFYLGRLALQRHAAAQAIIHLERAATLAPENSRIHNRLGDAYGLTAQKAGLFSKASWAKKCLAEYQKAVALDPKNIDAHFSLMNFYLQAPAFLGGGTEKALQAAETVKHLDPRRGRFAVASVQAAAKNYPAAIAQIDEELATNPGNYAALVQRGHLLERIGDKSGARQAYQAALTLDPGLPAAREALEKLN